MVENNTEKFWNTTVAQGQTARPSILDEETRNNINEFIASPPEAGAEVKGRYTPADLAHPWRDYQVQNCARRFLKEVVLPDWINNHPHKNCSGIYVDEWGRGLCKYSHGTLISVDGPWENPTHFLFYAYDNLQIQQYYNTRLSLFMRDYCDIDLS